MAAPSSTFLLAVCNAGFEGALKAEALTFGLRPSFSRPGFVTLKRDRDIDLDDLAHPPALVFARHLGLSLGRIEGDDAALARAIEATGARRLHVVAADEARAADADALRATLVPLAGVREGEEAKGPELVATVVLVDDARWLSLHRAKDARTPFPGGRPRLTLPEGAPSRAWLKLEEAARLFSLPFQAGERAVEIGSAPGGATFALLERGLEVVGIDPNEMDPRVASHDRFAHLKTTSMSVDAAALEPFAWLLLDVNVPPGTALRGALPFVRSHAETLRGLVFTLKLKETAIPAEIPSWTARIAAAAGFAVEARQLWSNGQEVCAVGVRR